MKPMPVVLVMFLIAGVVAHAGAQSTDVKQGKGNSKHDEYMTNEFYKTKPLTADSKGEKGSGKTSKHHIERIKAGKHNSSVPAVSGEVQNNEVSGKVTSDVTGKRVHKSLPTTHKRR